LALTPVGSGCSFLLVDGPPPPDKRDYRFYCSRSEAYPVADGIAAGSSLGWLAYTASKDDPRDQGVTASRRSEIALGLGLFALFVASAVVGNNWVSECRAAMDEQARNPPAPHL
jgi:hypothetical protein